MKVASLLFVFALAGQVSQTPPAAPLPPATRIANAVEAAHVDSIRVLITWAPAAPAAASALATQFTQALKSPVVVKTRYSADEYKLVNIDVGQLDKNMELAAKYGAKLSAELPLALTVLDDRGAVLTNASARELMSDAAPAAFDPEKIAAFFTKHQAPFPDAIAPFESALKQAKRDGKTVFVWFSAPW